jgi:hypothetical protein
MHLILLVCAAVLSASMPSYAQTRRPVPRRPAPPPPKPTMMVPEVTCPTPLGVGATTQRTYCDVMSGRDPAAGILIPLPMHRGPVTLSFDLHNRHTVSEETLKSFARYTATIGVLAMDNTLISRAVVQNEYRRVEDLVERIGGGAGPGGLKAVAPTGSEHIIITIPEEEQQVSILGEKLSVDGREGTANYTSPGRAIAVISNVMIEYVPGPPPRTTKPSPPPSTTPPSARKPAR